MTRKLILPLALLIVFQIIDIAVHVATGQIEPLRITSNAVITLGVFSAIFVPTRASLIILSSGLAYLALNVVFLLHEGLINPNNGSLRIPLFVFVIGSLLLAAWLHRQIKAANQAD